jgi:hypothetical protein
MKTIVSLCCYSEMFMSKDKIYAFFFENTKILTCCVRVFEFTCFFLKIQSKLEVCISAELFLERVR